MEVDDATWTNAKEQAIEILSATARDEETIPYGEFVRHIKAIPDLEYHGDPRLDELLDEISLEEDANGRGLISVLVVGKSFPHLPSDGFWKLAVPRHPEGTSKREIFEAERDRVWSAHRDE